MSQLAGSLDTNVLLRLLLNDVPKQHASALKLFNNQGGSFVIADIAIMEIVFVLTGDVYKFTREQASLAIEGILSIDKFDCNRKLFERALPLYVSHEALSFEDCCLSVYAVLGGATPLWTFDKKLAHQTASAKLVDRTFALSPSNKTTASQLQNCLSPVDVAMATSPEFKQFSF